MASLGAFINILKIFFNHHDQNLEPSVDCGKGGELVESCTECTVGNDSGSGCGGDCVFDKEAPICKEKDDVWGVYGAKGGLPMCRQKQFGVDMTVSDSLANIVREIEPECIIHLAAISSIPVCQKDALLAWRINHASTRELAKAAEERGCRLIFASTDQVFDGQRGLYREEHLPEPINVYGETKRAAERTIQKSVENSLVVRFNNTYGPPRFNGLSFSEWILDKEKRGEPITLFTNQYRSPIDVITVAKVLIELIENDLRGILHLGGPMKMDRVSFGNMLLEHMGRDTRGILRLHSTKHDIEGIMPQDTSFDISQARLRLETQIPLIEEGLRLAYGKPRQGSTGAPPVY